MRNDVKRWLLQSVLAPLVLATGASCMLVTDSCACSQPAGPFVGVEGTVTDESGAAVEGVGVILSVRDGACQALLAGPVSVATDTSGYYALGTEGAAEGTEACGQIEALRAFETSVDTVSSTVSLTYGFGPLETLDLVFPAR